MATLMVTGIAQNAQRVLIEGPATEFSNGPIEVDVNNGSFLAMVPLAPNMKNHLFFTSVGTNGVQSAPTPADVTRDGEAPSVFIDFPAPDAEITNGTTDVAGRVSDILSGFMGLTVTVNGVQAVVDPGIGTNGTFFLADVPLLDGLNAINVVARDTIGNQSTASLNVSKVAIDPDAAFMEVASGNAQEGPVQQSLSEPLVVRVFGLDDQPLQGKWVTFKVTRSDGRLSDQTGDNGAMMYQVQTDAQGLAMAYLKLGSDAGCGNNRVEATSRDVQGTINFCASAMPGEPKQIAVGTGNNQRGEAGAPSMMPLRAWVNDGCNGIEGVPVTFAVTRGGATVNGRDQVTVNTNGSGYAEVFCVLGPSTGNNIVEATFAGNPGMPAVFDLYGIRRKPGTPTMFSGLVLDNADRPIEGVTCRISVEGEMTDPVVSNRNGNFFFSEVPSGPAKLFVDGGTATALDGQPLPSGWVFPSLRYDIIIVENASNELSMPVMLPPLETGPAASGNEGIYNRTPNPSGANDLCLTLERLPGLKFTIVAGSMTVPDGNGGYIQPPPGTVVSINEVHCDDIPMPLPDGAAAPFAWTLQPGGAHFDPPVRVELPNMAGLPAGALTNILSWNHDTEQFDIVSTASISADGSTIVSDPGDGIDTAGWGGFCPPYPPTGDTDGDGDDDGDDDDGDDPDQEPPNEPDCGDGRTDPVYYFSGEMYLNVEDLRIRGRGTDFVWSRKYRSKIGPNTRQGNQWDCSYNIFVRDTTFNGGRAIALCNGNSREDLYQIQDDGTFRRNGFFHELRENQDGTFTLEHADKKVWEFNAFDGSPQAGLISALIDRNGNRISFAYNPAGQLVTITDTLDRDIAITYNTDGFIDTVTDFVGRQIRYEYYQNGDAGGSFGDLKSCTTQSVTGTPTGNDFPNGKTTVYTYSTGFADARLNHNLLTITDPKGQTFLTNVYAATTDEDNINFDRVMRQIWGDPGDIIDLAYIELDGTPGTEEPVIRTVLNDRVGNIIEYEYNERNLEVSQKIYTGRADPDQPTTDTANRPANKLRGTDPDYYETRTEWNDQFLRQRVVYPNGNSDVFIYEKDINPTASKRAEGNLRYKICRAETEEGLDALPLAAARQGNRLAPPDQAEIIEYFEYDTDFNGCCGFNFITLHRDGRGNTTRHEYDASGNRERTLHRIPGIVEEWTYNQFGQVETHTHPDNGSGHRRVDRYTYHAMGSERGYLEHRILDDGGFGLTTTFGYDDVGNVISITDARGNDTQFVLNELDQVVRQISREVDLNGTPTRYETDTFYDANDNVVRRDVQNIDETGTVGANTHFSTLYDHEILNWVVAVARESGSFETAIPGTVDEPDLSQLPDAEFIIEEFAYDANRNRTLSRQGEATNGNDPFNVVESSYDERDMLFETIRAPGSPDQSTTRLTYDWNGNLRQRTVGLEDASPRQHRMIHDGYSRLKISVDPMGNARLYDYDANDNVTREQVLGEIVDDLAAPPESIACLLFNGPVQLCDPAPSEAVVLAELVREYDNLDRLRRSDESFFDADSASANAAGTQIDDGLVTTTYDYSDSSQVVRVTNDNDNAVETAYDTANRVLTRTDEKNNVVAYSYDANSNVETVVMTEKSDLGGADQLFTTAFEYDGLDRRARMIDNVGSITRHEYDSRSNRVRSIDPLGNVVVDEYDGISRGVRTRRLLTDTGDGAGSVTGEIVTQQVWDDASRLLSQIDDNGNATLYLYDSLDRFVGQDFADGTISRSTLDPHGNIVQQVDGNGTVIDFQYDQLNRAIRKDVTVAAGVSDDTTFEIFEFDGRSRIKRAEDDDSIVLRSYDSLSRLTSESLNGEVTLSAYDGVGNMVSCTYPSGRLITTAYDSLERKSVISDTGGTIATYSYVGPNRVERRDYGNGTRAEYTYNGITGVPNQAEDFGVKRISETRHSVIGSGDVIDQRLYTWDRSGNKASRRNLIGGVLHEYDYDSVYRMVRSTRADAVQVVDPGKRASFTPRSRPDSTGTGGVSSSVAAAGRLGSDEAAPSRGGLVTGMIARPSTTGAPASNLSAGPMSGITTYAYDGVGNRTVVVGGDNPGAYTLESGTPEPADRQVNQYTTTPLGDQAYDANGNLLAISGVSGTQAMEYNYRNLMVQFRSLSGDETAYGYDALGRRIAKRRSATESLYFYTADWHVCEERSDGETTTFVYGRQVDELLNTVAAAESRFYHHDDQQSVVVVSSATGVEVVRYEYDSFGFPLGERGEDGVLFQGRRFDAESGWFYFRARYYDPLAGRFLSRDPLGEWGDIGNLGNALAFLGNSPLSRLDPYGLEWYDSLPDCPCTLDGDRGSEWYPPEDASQTFHPGAKQCIRSRPKKDGGPGQQCCYDDDGLIPWGPGAGTPDKVAPDGPIDTLDHFWQDVIPFYTEGWEDYTRPDSDWYPNQGQGCYAQYTCRVPPPPPPPPPPTYLCFVAGTLVLTSDGLEPIETVALGKEIPCLDDTTLTRTSGRIRRCVSGLAWDVIRVSVAGEVFAVTGDHPFWVDGAGWVPAKKLQGGELLRTASGDSPVVSSVEFVSLAQPVRVFTLTVDGAHTFFVGRSSILVHNK